MIASRSNGIRLITYRVPGFHGLFSQNAKQPTRPHGIVNALHCTGSFVQWDVVEDTIAKG